MSVLNRLIYIVAVLGSFGYNAVSKILPAYLATFVSSALSISLVPLSYNIGKIVSGIFGGILSDSYGIKKTLIASLLFMGFFSFLLVFGSTIEWFIAIFFFLGLSTSLFYISQNSLISIINRKKAGSLSNLEVSYQIGFIIGPVVAGAIAAAYGMVPVFLLWTLVSVIGSLVALKMNVVEQKRSKKSILLGLSELIRNDKHTFIFYSVLCICFIGFIEGVKDILIPLLAVDLGYDILSVGIIITISAIVTAVGIIPLGRIGDRLGNKIVIAVSILLISASFLLIGMVTDILFLGIFSGTLTIGRAGGLIGVRALMSEASSIKIRSTTMAIIELVLAGGRIIGAISAGIFKDFLMIDLTLTIFFWISIGFFGIFSIVSLIRK